MINWIKYDPKNLPEISKEFLIYAGSKPTVAKLELTHDDRLLWWTDHGFVGTVTYYAVINLPEEGTEQ